MKVISINKANIPAKIWFNNKQQRWKIERRKLTKKKTVFLIQKKTTSSFLFLFISEMHIIEECNNFSERTNEGKCKMKWEWDAMAWQEKRREEEEEKKNSAPRSSPMEMKYVFMKSAASRKENIMHIVVIIYRESTLWFWNCMPFFHPSLFIVQLAVVRSVGCMQNATSNLMNLNIEIVAT